MTQATHLQFQGIMAAFRRFSVADYHRLIAVGILAEDDNVELLDGYLVQKKPHTPPHDAALQKGNKTFFRLLPPGWDMRVQSAITLTDSEPEPDVVIVRGDEKTYLTRHPTTADIGLVVEVSDSTLVGDRDDKGRVYAKEGIECYWIVNLNDQQVEVYTSPSGPIPDPQYAQRVDYQMGDSLTLLLAGAAALQMAVQDLLP